ncbi:Leucine-rich repeat/Leucine rich repeat [Novymonas esmeraldas]|uniref:Leucine-rich repeat/Leucine rich repeat n=1 Tax=Novymonas esmeraldas TaxID=1808958 RepID=A0AAW0EKG1_9TRYP
MRTRNQQRYYGILHREDGTHATARRCGSAPATTQASGGGGGATASTARFTVSVCTGGGVAGDTAGASVCDPLTDLGLSAATAPALVEYVCTHRGFTALHHNFLRLEHLRCLVVDHNAFSTLHNLVLPPPHAAASPDALLIAASPADRCPLPAPPLYRGCRRLTHLHATHNRLRDIAADTDIPRLPLLEHLSLAHNKLTDLDKVLRALRRLRNLSFLDLRDNPVTGEPRYRERCVAALPQVEVLDCQSVTATERAAAAAVARLQRRSRDGKPRHTAAAAATTTTMMSTSGGGPAAVGGERPGTCPGAARAGHGGTRVPFAKSITVRDLDRHYHDYLRQRRLAEELVAQSTAAARHHHEETWRSFHAMWALAQPGMPLSADSWQRTSAVAAAAAAAAAPELGDGEGERREAQSFVLLAAPGTRAPPLSTSSGGASTASSPLRAGRKATTNPFGSIATTTATAATTPTSAAGAGNRAAAAAAAVALLTVDVPLDRLQLPSTPAASAAGSPVSTRSPLSSAATRGGAAPPISTAAAMAASSRGVLPTLHDSVYFRAVRGDAPVVVATPNTCGGGGAAAAVGGTTVASSALLPTGAPPPPAVSRLLPVDMPAPDRLATLRSALQASSVVVRAAAAAAVAAAAGATASRPGTSGPSAMASMPAPAAPAAAAAAATLERSTGGRRYGAPSPASTATTAAAAAAASMNITVDYGTLRTIQEAQYAVVPPPWEKGDAVAAIAPQLTTPTATSPTTHDIGSVSATTEQQEALAEVLVLLHDVYSLDELQALEGEYGGADLLRLLPLREWSAIGTETGTGDTVGTAVAARQAMSALSRPGSGGSAPGGGGGGGRGPADRKRSIMVRPATHGGGAAGGTAGARGGGGSVADPVSGSTSAAAVAALAAARTALAVDPAQVWQLLTGPFVVAGATTATASATAAATAGVVVTLSRAAAGDGRAASTSPAAKSGGPGTTNTTTTTVAATAPGGATGTGSGSAASASSTAAGSGASATAAAAPAASLQDPEAVQHLVRPIGPYEPHVLGPLLALLRAPVSEQQVRPMCAALAARHALQAHITAAATAMVTAVAADPLPRSASAGARAKKESLSLPSSAEESAGADAKRKRNARSPTPALHTAAAAGATPSSAPSLPSAPGPHTRFAGRTAQAQLLQQQQQQQQQQLQRQSVDTQLTLTAVLTALLFSPAFIATRITHLEAKLARVAATATTGVIAVAERTGQRRGLTFADNTSPGKDGNAAALSRLFHRVQAIKAHAARMHAATSTSQTHDDDDNDDADGALRLLSPMQVLTAYTGRQ